MIPAWVASGEIGYMERVVRGLENTPQVTVDMRLWDNFGKCVLVVADE